VTAVWVGPQAGYGRISQDSGSPLFEEMGAGERGSPMIPPRPQAAKYFPLYSSILGFGRAFSRDDILAFAAQFL
jgi:hypothetical protein